MLDFDSNACQFSIGAFLSGSEFSSARLFFRLPSFLDRWFVPLEAGILVQDRLGRISNAFGIGNLFVVGLANVSVAQEVDAFPWQGHDDDVLVGVRLLLAAVVQGLFFRVFRPLSL